MRPVVDGLKQEYGDRVEFKEIDFYENREAATQYGAPGHPTLVIIRADGSRVKILPGVSSEEAIVAALNEALQ